MNELQKAYQDWVKTSPINFTANYRRDLARLVKAYRSVRAEHPSLSYTEVESYLRDNGFSSVLREQNRSCCSYEHVTRDLVNGLPVVNNLPDNSVCPRERAWRRYTRVRDGLPIDGDMVN